MNPIRVTRLQRDCGCAFRDQRVWEQKREAAEGFLLAKGRVKMMVGKNRFEQKTRYPCAYIYINQSQY